MKLVYVFDPREASGTYLPMRVPTLLARALCRMRTSLDYAPTESGYTHEPYPDTYAGMMRKHARTKRYVYVLSVLVLACFAYIGTHRGTHTSTAPSASVCWEEARDADEADLYCGTYAQSTHAPILGYVDVLPTQAVTVCTQAKTDTDLAQCVRSFVDHERNN